MSLTVNINAGPASNQLVLSPDHTIGSLTQRVYAMTGFEIKTIRYFVDGKLIDDPLTPLGSLTRSDILNITVTGKSEFGDLTDASGVEKFEISDAAYDAMKGTVRDIKRKAGVPVKGDIKKPSDTKPEGVEVGMRCEAELLDHSHHRGVIRFVGKVEGSSGYWIGIELDEPFGNNDGITKTGKRCFQTDEHRGVFLRPSKVKVGDYPEIDWEAEFADEM